MKTEKQRRLAALGGLCGAAYLTLTNVLPGAPELLLGLLLGLTIVFLIGGLLPDETRQKLRKWKRRGE